MSAAENLASWQVFRDGQSAVVVDTANGTLVTKLPYTAKGADDGALIRVALLEKFASCASEPKAANAHEPKVPAAKSHFVEYEEGMPLGQVYVKPAPEPDTQLEDCARDAASALYRISNVVHTQGSKELSNDLRRIAWALDDWHDSTRDDARKWLKAFLGKPQS